MPTLERAVKWVWLILGGLILAAIAGSAIWAVTQVAFGGGGDSVVPARKTAAAAPANVPALRYDLPDRIPGTETSIVVLRAASGDDNSSEYSSYSGRGPGPLLNVAFMDAAGVRLLLDRPAYIASVGYRGGEGGGGSSAPGADTVLAGMRWIVYEMALGNANHDRRLDRSDSLSLFVTDRQGRGLRQVLPPGFRPLSWRTRPDGGLDILALAPPTDPRHHDENTRQERAFVLEPGGQLRPLPQLDSATVAAGRIVGK